MLVVCALMLTITMLSALALWIPMLAGGNAMELGIENDPGLDAFTRFSVRFFWTFHENPALSGIPELSCFATVAWLVITPIIGLVWWRAQGPP